MSALIDWDGTTRQPCPECARGPKDRTCGVTLDDRGGVAHCYRCGYVRTTRGTHRRGVAVARKEIEKRLTLSDLGRSIWESCRSIDGDARAYLDARMCKLPPVDGDLRWHPALRHPLSGLKWPALVALVTDAVTGLPLTLHHTWLGQDGKKAQEQRPRLLLRGHRKQGGVVRLWPEECVSCGLAIAEGIETALSAARAFTPVWSCLDAGNLRQFPVLAGIECLVVACDNDDSGVKAALDCVKRWREAGRRADWTVPQQPGHDWNDEARTFA